MATPIFPTIIPNAIAFDFGTLNTSQHKPLGTSAVRFRRTLKASGNALQLTYVGLSQTQVEEIRQHYRYADGTHRVFAIPSAIWGNYRSAAGDAAYRYTRPPEEEHMGLYYNVTITLNIITTWVVQTILQGPPAYEPDPFAFSSFFLTGYAPFRVVAPDSTATPTVDFIFTARGAAG